MKLLLMSLLILGVLVSNAFAADISLNGFGSFYGGQNLTNGRYVTNFPDKNPAFAPFSVLGVNVGTKITDKIQFQAQFVASGENTIGSSQTPDWELRANWAFLSFEVSPDWHIKVGRQLFPAWLAAEFIDVGFLQPYRELPDGVEGISPYESFDGVLSDYVFDLGSAGHLTYSLFGGRAESDVGSNGNSISATSQNFLGNALTLKGDGYKVRAQINRGYGVTTGNGFPEKATNDYNYTLGASYDKHHIVVWSEYGTVKSNEKVAGLFPGTFFLQDLHAFYVLVGYRIGPFMPRYLWSDCNYNQGGFGSGRSFTHNFGVNYQVTDQVIFKFDYYLELFKDVGASGVAASGAVAIPGPSASAITAGIDFIF